MSEPGKEIKKDSLRCFVYFPLGLFFSSPSTRQLRADPINKETWRKCVLGSFYTSVYWRGSLWETRQDLQLTLLAIEQWNEKKESFVWQSSETRCNIKIFDTFNLFLSFELLYEIKCNAPTIPWNVRKFIFLFSFSFHSACKIRNNSAKYFFAVFHLLGEMDEEHHAMRNRLREIFSLSKIVVWMGLVKMNVVRLYLKRVKKSIHRRRGEKGAKIRKDITQREKFIQPFPVLEKY